MTYPQVQLVDAPTSSATVLFDFNDDTALAKREVRADGFSLGFPELVGDVDAVDPLYGPRTISFTCRLTGTKPNALAAQSAVARRLMAGRGWLRVRMNSTSDIVFFRTYRAQPADLSLEEVRSTSNSTVDIWDLELDLPAEPFGYGERVTQAAQVLNGDPAAVSNACHIVLPAVVGDAPTRPRVSLVPTSTLSVSRLQLSLTAAASAATPKRFPIGTGDGFIAITDTAAGTADAAYSSGSYRAVSFTSDPAMNSRLSGTFSNISPGRYRVLLRVGKPVGTSSFTLRFNDALGGIAGAVVPVSASTSAGAAWVDLGTFSFPASIPASFGEQGPSVNQDFMLEASRTSATGSLHLDHFMLVPVASSTIEQARTLTVDVRDISSARALRIDADNEEAWVFTTATGALWYYGASLSGSPFVAVPGLAHVLTLNAIGNGPSDPWLDVITRNYTVTVAYHPRWLWIGDS